MGRFLVGNLRNIKAARFCEPLFCCCLFFVLFCKLFEFLVVEYDAVGVFIKDVGGNAAVEIGCQIGLVGPGKFFAVGLRFVDFGSKEFAVFVEAFLGEAGVADFAVRVDGKGSVVISHVQGAELDDVVHRSFAGVELFFGGENLFAVKAECREIVRNEAYDHNVNAVIGDAVPDVFGRSGAETEIGSVFGAAGVEATEAFFDEGSA